MVDFLLHVFCCVDTEQTDSPYPKELSDKATFMYGTDAFSYLHIDHFRCWACYT